MSTNEFRLIFAGENVLKQKAKELFRQLLKETKEIDAKTKWTKVS